MPAPSKIGLDYFSHDVSMSSDRKIKLLKSKHKLIGFAIFIILLEDIYKDEGYFIKITEEYLLLLSEELNINVKELTNIVNDCVKFNLFNKNIYDKYKILTSKRIQKNFLFGSLRRTKISFKKNLLLIEPFSEINTTFHHKIVIFSDNNNNETVENVVTINKIRLSKFPKKSNSTPINDNINSVNDNINSVNDNINSVNDGIYCTKESKVKESKVNDSKEKKIKEKNKINFISKESLISKFQNKFSATELLKFYDEWYSLRQKYDFKYSDGRNITDYNRDFEGFLNHKLKKSNTKNEILSPNDFFNKT